MHSDRRITIFPKDVKTSEKCNPLTAVRAGRMCLGLNRLSYALWPLLPVRILMHSGRYKTKILSSPVFPVRVPLTIALMLGSTNSSFTATSSFTFFSSLTSRLTCPNTSVYPLYWPQPRALVTVAQNPIEAMQKSRKFFIMTLAEFLAWMMPASTIPKPACMKKTWEGCQKDPCRVWVEE